MKKFLLFIITFFSFVVFAAPNDKDSMFNTANNLYLNKQYEDAIGVYQNIVKKGVQSDVLYYNLANSYYKNKEYAYAILYFEKSLKLNPHNQEAKTNLGLSRSKNEDKIEPVSEILLVKFWRKLVNLFSPNQWAILSLVLFWLVFVSLIILLISKNIKTKKLSVFFSFVFVVASVLFAIMGYARSSPIRNTNSAIIISASTSLFASPDKNSSTTLSIHSGTKIFIEDQIGNWYKIKTEDKRGGWIEKSSFAKI